ncbi:MAG: two-component system response regulator [Rhizobiales bacterium 32-66-11]|nr:MAG: two-component system response regulator [Rhizobiales bacterium 32-66-11]
MLRTLIVEDEPLARRALRRLLSVHRGVAVVGEAETVAEAMHVIERERPELVFLDIALVDGSGFEVLAGLDQPPKVVFVTAHPEHALQAFSVEAIDYLLKPVSAERLAETPERVQRARGGVQAALIELRTPSRSLLVEPNEIAALKADGDFAQIVLADQAPVMILRTLTHFEHQLPSPPFLRLGRSLMINRNRLRRIEVRSRDDIWLTMDGMPLPLAIGRAAAHRLRAALGSLRL